MNEVGSIQNMRFLLDQSWTSFAKAAYFCLISFISTSQMDDNAFNIINWIIISERFLGTILISTFLVTLARKVIRQ